MVPRPDPELTRTSAPGGAEMDVEPDLLDFTDLFFEDSLEGKARPLAEYLKRFPRAEAAVAKEWLRLMGVDEETEALTPPEDAVEGEERVGHYRLLKELGRGGQGAVWLAQDTRIARKVAIKFMPAGFGLISEDKKGRFRREAEVIARLEHPGLCRIYDADVEADSPWIAMRLVEGEALSARISRAHSEDESSRDKEVLPVAPQSKAELFCLLRFFERVARALHAAHEASVIHRDIKPGNIMISPEGEPVLLDFGMARGDDLGMQELTASGDVFGTPSYMSPEQVRGASSEIDVRTDIWSLAVTLQEALTLERPFGGQGTAEILSSVLTGVPRKPSEGNPLVTDELDVVVSTALERDLSRRYPTALEFAEELRRICEYEPIHARPAGPFLKLARWARRHPALAASVTISFLSLTAGLVTTTWLRAKEQVALDHALGRHLADRSRVHLGLNPNLALNLAIDAMELSPHELTRSALVAAMMENRLHATLPAHPQKQYRDLDLSPDVELAVMALAGGTVRVFDLESNAMLWESPLHGAELLATRFSSDGEKIVSVSSDGHLIRWDREGSVLEELRLEEALTSAVIAADGERVAVVTEGGDALVCTAGMGAGQLLPVESLVEAVWLVCDDERLVAVDEAGVARCYSLSDSKLVLECALETEIVAVAGEAGGGVLACGGSDGEIELWELGGSRLVGSLSHGGELAGLRFSDGSDVLVSWGGGGGADDGGRVTVWSMATMESICSMNSERSVRDIALDPAGRRIAVCDGTKVVDLYDLQLGTHLGSLRQPWLLSGLRWSADGRRIGGLTGTGIAPIWSLDQRFGAPEAFSRLGSPVELLGVDGQTLVLHENGVLASWDVATGLVAAIDVGAIGSVRGMSESISGGDVLVWGDGGVAILDVEARELPWLLESAAGVEFAQGDNEIGVGRDSEGLVFWWQADGVRRELGSAWHIALSSDRAWIATGGEGTEVLLRPTAPGVEARTIAFEARWRSPVDIYSLVFQPDGAVLSVGAVDRKIRFFDVETGAALAQYRGLVFEELSYSLDGKAILGLPGDRHFARILDPLTGRRLMDNRTHHEEDVVAADLDSAAQFAVTGSLDGVIQVWSVAGGSAFVIHDHGDVPISDVIFDGEGEELRVLAAAWDGLLWGLAVHPMNSAFEHEPEAMSTSDAQKETESALPFSYSPLRKLSGISTEG